MKVVRTIAELREELDSRREICRREGKRGITGLVPTMGFLHEGHASLIRRCVEETDIAVLSIFVNPTQFGPNEDFERYPRNEEKDLELARTCGADFVFAPDVNEMYPQPSRTSVKVSEVTERLCGASRPGHFDGVGLVVSKLFHIVEPDFAYFGMKDAQQVAVIQTMVNDLNMRVTIVPCPIVRDADGLALSSRNVYLSPEERKQALVLSQSLRLAEGWLAESDDLQQLKARIEAHIRTAPLAVIDYVDVLTFPSLMPPVPGGAASGNDTQLLVALAVKFGSTRLIDNRLLPFLHLREEN